MKYNNATVRVLSPVAATTSTSTTIKKHQQKRGTTAWPNRITVFFQRKKNEDLVQ